MGAYFLERVVYVSVKLEQGIITTNRRCHAEQVKAATNFPVTIATFSAQTKHTNTGTIVATIIHSRKVAGK